MGWYVVQVRSGHEIEISEKCKKLIPKSILLDCFIPEYTYQKKYTGSWHEVKDVMFKGYFFLITDEIEILNVELNKIPDSMKLIGKKKAEIFPLDDEEVMFLQSFGKDDHIVDVSVGYIQGDKVHVTKGPLKGKEGLITKIDRHKRIAYLQIDMFKKETIAKVGLEIISKE